MMPARFKNMAAAVLTFCVPAMFLTGCWDSRTIEDQLILTGISMDVSDNPNQISVMAQGANIKQGKAGSGETGNEGGDEFIVLKATGDSVMACLTEIDRDSSQRILFPHNQIRLFGIELAEQGIQKHLDLIMRDPKARFEVPLAIVDGRGEEALTAKLAEMPISALFLGNLFEAQAGISVQYRVRLIDFVQRLLDDAASPVVPIIKVTTGEDEKQEIKIAGMAVFHGDKMVGRLTNEEAIGYILSFGDVKRCNISVYDGTDIAGLHIATLDCKREVTLQQDGGVRVSLTINSVANVSELHGFEEMKPPELLKHLENLAQEEIKNKITGCFSAAQTLAADIFGFCTMVFKKYPRQWSEMKARWGELFTDIDLHVQVKVRIPETGQIVQSLEIEENMK